MVTTVHSQRTKSPSKVYLGIDPASSGAAAVLRGDTVAVVLYWKKVTKKKKSHYQIKIARDNFSVETMLIKSNPIDLVNQIIKLPELRFRRPIIAIEDTYFSINPSVAINLAKFSGRMCGYIESHFNVESSWVRAADWRKKVLDLSHFTKRKEAKSASLNQVPGLVKGLKEILNVLGKHDHITDAVGIALWAKNQTEGVKNGTNAEERNSVPAEKRENAS